MDSRSYHTVSTKYFELNPVNNILHIYIIYLTPLGTFPIIKYIYILHTIKTKQPTLNSGKSMIESRESFAFLLFPTFSLSMSWNRLKTLENQ